MEIDKSVSLNASASRVWALLLDPQAMGACVPGMESIEVLTPEEYKAVMKVKIAFISARFTLRTRIVERREPLYLKAEGVGEDAAVASSLKYVTEIHLNERPDGGTDLHIKVQVDLLGRMGNFGLSVMKTKADRLWDEFGVELAAQLAGNPSSGPAAAQSPCSENGQVHLGSSQTDGASKPGLAKVEKTTTQFAEITPEPPGLWARCLRVMGIQPSVASTSESIVVEIRRPDQTHIKLVWPQSKSTECLQWLREETR
jgi:carbon monoxide dehydrogenase subunit G